VKPPSGGFFFRARSLEFAMNQVPVSVAGLKNRDAENSVLRHFVAISLKDF
jgi:hypothetical protein